MESEKNRNVKLKMIVWRKKFLMTLILAAIRMSSRNTKTWLSDGSAIYFASCVLSFHMPFFQKKKKNKEKIKTNAKEAIVFNL